MDKINIVWNIEMGRFVYDDVDELPVPHQETDQSERMSFLDYLEALQPTEVPSSPYENETGARWRPHTI